MDTCINDSFTLLLSLLLLCLTALGIAWILRPLRPFREEILRQLTILQKIMEKQASPEGD